MILSRIEDKEVELTETEVLDTRYDDHGAARLHIDDTLNSNDATYYLYISDEEETPHNHELLESRLTVTGGTMACAEAPPFPFTFTGKKLVGKENVDFAVTGIRDRGVPMVVFPRTKVNIKTTETTVWQGAISLLKSKDLALLVDDGGNANDLDANVYVSFDCGVTWYLRGGFSDINDANDRRFATVIPSKFQYVKITAKKDTSAEDVYFKLYGRRLR